MQFLPIVAIPSWTNSHFDGLKCGSRQAIWLPLISDPICHFILSFSIMTNIYVQTFYGAENGWRNVGGRRTARDAARFCALLGRIRNDRLNKVAEVPVRFVLGEWCWRSWSPLGRHFLGRCSHPSRQSGLTKNPLFFLSSDHDFSVFAIYPRQNLLWLIISRPFKFPYALCPQNWKICMVWASITARTLPIEALQSSALWVTQWLEVWNCKL